MNSAPDPAFLREYEQLYSAWWAAHEAAAKAEGESPLLHAYESARLVMLRQQAQEAFDRLAQFVRSHPL